MKQVGKLTKWGNSAAVRVPKTMVDTLGWSEDEPLHIECDSVSGAITLWSQAKPRLIGLVELYNAWVGKLDACEMPSELVGKIPPSQRLSHILNTLFNSQIPKSHALDRFCLWLGEKLQEGTYTASVDQIEAAAAPIIDRLKFAVKDESTKTMVVNLDAHCTKSGNPETIELDLDEFRQKK